MSLAAMMVHVDVDPPSDARIRLAAGLSSNFDWRLRLGAASATYLRRRDCRPKDNRGHVAGIFRAARPSRRTFPLTCGTRPDRGVAIRQRLADRIRGKEARAVDLLIVGRDRIAGDSSRSLDPGAVALKAGRPLLVVPPDIQSLAAEGIVIGWKDTREARRAVRDALPLLREASRVAIVEVADPQDQDQSRLRIDDVARYLTRHGVKLTKPPTPDATGSVAGELLRIAGEQKADLIVAGAYGHNRLGEWLFGGVTEELFRASPM